MAETTDDLNQACSTCEYATFDPVWNEWRCEILRHKIRHPVAVDDCIYYEEKIITFTLEDDEE